MHLIKIKNFIKKRLGWCVLRLGWRVKVRWLVRLGGGVLRLGRRVKVGVVC